MQLFKITADDVAQLDVLEVVPAALVPRVQVRGVTGQRFQTDLATCARDESPTSVRRWIGEPSQTVSNR